MTSYFANRCELCGKTYESSESLEGHKNANHWKALHPNKRGRK